MSSFVQTLVAVKPTVCLGAKSEGVCGVGGKVVGVVAVATVVGALSTLLLLSTTQMEEDTDVTLI